MSEKAALSIANVINGILLAHKYAAGNILYSAFQTSADRRTRLCAYQHTDRPV